MDRRTTGIYHKFNVERTDGTDQPGGKHHGCRYFVLDLDHDKCAKPAMAAYAEACESEYPALAADLRIEAGETLTLRARLSEAEARAAKAENVCLQERDEWASKLTKVSEAHNAIAANCSRLREALEEFMDFTKGWLDHLGNDRVKGLAMPLIKLGEAALAETPSASLAKIKADIYRDLADETQLFDANQREWFRQQADALAKGGEDVR